MGDAGLAGTRLAALQTSVTVATGSSAAIVPAGLLKAIWCALDAELEGAVTYLSRWAASTRAPAAVVAAGLPFALRDAAVVWEGGAADITEPGAAVPELKTGGVAGADAVLSAADIPALTAAITGADAAYTADAIAPFGARAA